MKNVNCADINYCHFGSKGPDKTTVPDSTRIASNDLSFCVLEIKII
jgi:hypothetical protein